MWKGVSHASERWPRAYQCCICVIRIVAPLALSVHFTGTFVTFGGQQKQCDVIRSMVGGV